MSETESGIEEPLYTVFRNTQAITISDSQQKVDTAVIDQGAISRIPTVLQYGRAKLVATSRTDVNVVLQQQQLL